MQPVQGCVYESKCRSHRPLYQSFPYIGSLRSVLQRGQIFISPPPPPLSPPPYPPSLPLLGFKDVPCKLGFVWSKRFSPAGDRWCDVLGSKVVSQAPQNFISSDTQATCKSYFLCQSICSAISFPGGMSRAVHPQESSRVDVEHRHVPIWASDPPPPPPHPPPPFFFFFFFFFSKCIESAKMSGLTDAS